MVQRELYDAEQRRWSPTRTASRTRAGAGRAARRPPRRRPDRAAGGPGERWLGVDRAGGPHRDDRRCPSGRHGRRGGGLRQRPWRGGHPSPPRASAIGASWCCRGRWRPRPDGLPSVRWPRWPPRWASTAHRAVRVLAQRLAAARPGAAVRRRPPTAMFCLSDSIAYGVCVACAELGLAIPADVSVAGFGEHPISAPARPAAHVDDLGRRARRTCGNRLPAGRVEDERPICSAARSSSGPGSARVDGPPRAWSAGGRAVADQQLGLPGAHGRYREESEMSDLLERLEHGPVSARRAICSSSSDADTCRPGLCTGGGARASREGRRAAPEFVHAGSDVVEAFTYYAHREKLRLIGGGAARADQPPGASDRRRGRGGERCAARRQRLQHQRVRGAGVDATCARCSRSRSAGRPRRGRLRDRRDDLVAGRGDRGHRGHQGDRAAGGGHADGPQGSADAGRVSPAEACLASRPPAPTWSG